MKHCLTRFSCVASIVGLALTPGVASGQGEADTALNAMTGAELARIVNTAPDAGLLADYHEVLSSEPHDAGTPGDRRVVDLVSVLFETFGLQVEVEELDLYLSRPVDAEVRVLAPDLDPEHGLGLALREREVDGDPFSADESARPGWNAYSGSGDVTGGVVYANFGRLEDFQKLESIGVSCAGKVVVARYGGNFRGYKAKYAQEAGAVGLIIYSDPADVGWARGLAWPEGGFANGSSIQRGSILTLEHGGDPLTPFAKASGDVRRANPETVALPKIPVQPMGWDAASEILGRMTGDEAPGGWQGGLPFRYRVDGGDELRVRVRVEQVREITRTWNVIGTLPGWGEPEREVILGSHHDSWGFGAGDSLSGLICLLEAARSFGELAGEGVLPRRTLRFCAWGAEEHGIIGSSEHVEGRARAIGAGAVAYINLDMVAMGPNFGASASPSLRAVIAEAAREVPQAGAADRSVFEAWIERGADPDEPGRPRMGDLGGGSDHVGFLCHACVPSTGFHAGGSRGNSYHTLYDNLAWYRRVVGDDYEPALMVTRMAVGVAARLAQERVIPVNPIDYARSVLGHLPEPEATGSITEEQLKHARGTVIGTMPAYGGSPPWRDGGVLSLDDAQVERINTELMAVERAWCANAFDDGRSWFRNGFAAPDATSGYAAWMLPGIRRALHEGDAAHLASQAKALSVWGRQLADRVRAIDAILEQSREVDDSGVGAPDPSLGDLDLEPLDEAPSDP